MDRTMFDADLTKETMGKGSLQNFNIPLFGEKSGISREGEKKELTQAIGATPVVPLPNPSEGGAVYPGNGTVYPGNGTEEIPPTPNGGTEDITPVIPLPNPSEGGAVYPGNGAVYPENGNDNILSNIIGTIISTYPRPNEPCRLCGQNNARTGLIRFLNATTGYAPFVVYVDDSMVARKFGSGEITNYERISTGRHIVTVMGENGYIFIQKPIEMFQNAYLTVAIVNTDSGLDFELIMDGGCNKDANSACVRVANLAYDVGVLTVVIGKQYIIFPNIRYRDVSDFETIWPGLYLYTVMRNQLARLPMQGNVLLHSAVLNVQKNRNITIYLLSTGQNQGNELKVLVVEDL